MAFLEYFLIYLGRFILLGAVAVAGVCAGAALRKRKDSKG